MTAREKSSKQIFFASTLLHKRKKDFFTEIDLWAFSAKIAIECACRLYRSDFDWRFFYFFHKDTLFWFFVIALMWRSLSCVAVEGGWKIAWAIEYWNVVIAIFMGVVSGFDLKIVREMVLSLRWLKFCEMFDLIGGVYVGWFNHWGISFCYFIH